jgi:hypothetical protein
MGEQ